MTEPVRIGDCELWLGDCLAVLPSLADVNAVITDPPFEEEAHTMQRRVLGKGITASRAIDNQPLPFAALTEEQRTHLSRWAAESCSGWFLAFCQTEAVGAWKQELVRAGAKWRRAGIWSKPDGSPQISGDRPAPGHEAIAMAWCGNGRSVWNGGGSRAVWTYGKHDDGMGHGGAPKEHPTQKPRLLMERLVGLFSQPGDVVCDPFMGAGSTGVAAVNLGRAFVGVEIDPAYFAIACRRIEQAYAQRPLFAAEPPKPPEQLGLEA
jgi:site-specific DNA-methyltransferase (adenine-specific)